MERLTWDLNAAISLRPAYSHSILLLCIDSATILSPATLQTSSTSSLAPTLRRQLTSAPVSRQQLEFRELRKDL